MRELRIDYDKSKWYRIEERESVKHVASLPVGTKITTTRQIARVGYYFQPNDAPLLDIVNMRVPALEAELDHTLPMRIDDLINALGITERQFWRGIDYRNRGKWQREQAAKLGDAGGLRVAWYEDYAYPEPLTIIGTQAAWQGEHYEGRSGRGWIGDGDFDEGDSGGLSSRAYLKYYVCESRGGYIVYVHPLDAKEVNS